MVTVSRRHTKRSSSCLPRCLRLNCLCPPVRRTPCSSFGSRAVRSLDCAHSTSQGLRASSGRGRPAMRFGELAWLAHRGCCTQGCAHTEREFVHRLQRAVGSVKWQDMRGRSSPLQHMQRAGTQSGGTEGCITQERQRQCAASHKSVVHWQSRIALAKITHDGRCWVQEGERPKFTQVCSRRNLPHFGQRAISSKCRS